MTLPGKKVNFYMKAIKLPLIVGATLLVAVISIAASGRVDDRPAAIPAERWIAISEKAGFALTSETGSSSVGAELYLKTEKGWRRGRIENPVSGTLLAH